MRHAKHTGTAICVALLLVCCVAGGSAVAQTAPAAAVRPQLTATGDPQKAALTDVDHLLQMARELKASVDKTRRDELSVEVIREADEIEKLARSTKARIH